MSLIILLHSSKTMVAESPTPPMSSPRFVGDAAKFVAYLARLSTDELRQAMHVSAPLAGKVAATIQQWSPHGTAAAIESFRGDIYSGLRSLDFTEPQKSFAQKHLIILSGLYGALRPYDAVSPYRMEAAYRFVGSPYANLYDFWGSRLAEALPVQGIIINVTSVEYDKLILPYISSRRVITPRFLTRAPGKTEPTFVVVHAKIARGAFARWLIRRGVDSAEGLEKFDDLGYVYDPTLSLPDQPVYICNEFKGIGLSQRLV